MSTSTSAGAPRVAAARMGTVAVVAHRRKTLGGGLDELWAELAGAGVEDPIWYEVPKSRKAPKKVRKALKKGAELIFVWGGDGMVQRCADALAGHRPWRRECSPTAATRCRVCQRLARQLALGGGLVTRLVTECEVTPERGKVPGLGACVTDFDRLVSVLRVAHQPILPHGVCGPLPPRRSSLTPETLPDQAGAVEG